MSNDKDKLVQVINYGEDSAKRIVIPYLYKNNLKVRINREVEVKLDVEVQVEVIEQVKLQVDVEVESNVEVDVSV
jgi:hypothetical protein